MAYCYYDLGIQGATLPANLHYGGETGAIAEAIASGRGFSSPLPLPGIRSGPTAWLPPIYPYLLAGIFKLFGIFTYKSSLIIRSIDMAFSAFTCWPVYAIGRRAFGRTAAILSAWVWALLPDGIFYSVIWTWDTALPGLCMALLFSPTLQIPGRTLLPSLTAYRPLLPFGPS